MWHKISLHDSNNLPGQKTKQAWNKFENDSDGMWIYVQKYLEWKGEREKKKARTFYILKHFKDWGENYSNLPINL